MATDVWGIYEELGQTDRSQLTEERRKLLAILDLRQEVNSDGFDGYFRYWGGDTATTALAALPDLLGQEWADLLREAVELLGDPYPDDPDDRAARIDNGSLDESLNELDERFYELEASTDADSRLNEYLDANPD